MYLAMNDPRPASAFALAVLAFLPARFDDPAKGQGKQTVPIPVLPGAEEDPHAQMAKVFVQIEHDLREIDRLLSDASTGESSTKEAAEKSAVAIAGIDELILNSEKKSQAVLDGIDKLFELANHSHQPGGT